MISSKAANNIVEKIFEFRKTAKIWSSTYTLPGLLESVSCTVTDNNLLATLLHMHALELYQSSGFRNGVQIKSSGVKI
jgi:hypothetical protein